MATKPEEFPVFTKLDEQVIKDSLILSEPFDYTEWQRDLYGDMPLDEFYEKVKAVRV